MIVMIEQWAMPPPSRTSPSGRLGEFIQECAEVGAVKHIGDAPPVAGARVVTCGGHR
jgi:hypothetical protein